MEAKEKELQDVTNVKEKEIRVKEGQTDVPHILEEITIEELAVDGICGIY